MRVHNRRVNRREFFLVAGGGLAASLPRARAQAGTPLKHWAWMKSAIQDVDAWRRSLADLKAAGFHAILMTGTAGSYRKYLPLVRDEGLELHAWMFTMMRGEHVASHPEWYAVSRSGASTAVKPPYVDYYKFMCPSRDEVREYLRMLVGEIAAVDGLVERAPRLHPLPGRHSAGGALAEIQARPGQGVSGLRLLLLRGLPRSVQGAERSRSRASSPIHLRTAHG